ATSPTAPPPWRGACPASARPARSSRPTGSAPPTWSCPVPTQPSTKYARSSATRASSRGDDLMARTAVPAHPGLTSRMLGTMFLLGLLYVVFVAVLIAILKSWVLIVVIAGGFLFFQYFFSDRIPLAAMRGPEVAPPQASE